MKVRNAKPLLARTPPDRFIGREAELERLYMRAVSANGQPAVHVSGRPRVGVSELLRQLYDRLFYEQRFVIPFYFTIHPKDRNSFNNSSRYLYQFLLQTVAFRRQEPDLIAASPDICELSKLAPIQDATWVNQMCEVCANDGPLNDERAFIRSALNAPFRASSSGQFQVFAIVDDLHEAALLDDGDLFRNELLSIAERGNVPLLLASREGFVPHVRATERIEIEPLMREEIAQLAGELAANADVPTNNETRDLIAVQLGSRPGLIELFIQAARSRNRPLDSYRDIERLYSEELLTGNIGAYFDRMFLRSAPDPTVRQKLFDELYFTVGAANESFPIEALRHKLGVDRREFIRIVDALEIDGLLSVDNGYARLVADDVFRDFLIARHRSAAGQKAPASIAALTVTNALKRAPKIMSRTYRREAALGLADILLNFDLQDVPRSLIDYRDFRDDLKGLSDEGIRSQLSTKEKALQLPQISHSAPIVDHLPDFGESVEPERAVAGVGFTDRGYTDEDEVAWFAAEIDSKLEADPSLTQEWCDRLEAAATDLGYSNYKIWLIAPEGFSDAALNILNERNGFGSSRRQAELLKSFLSGTSGELAPRAAEYEMVIPIGAETELIAAHALEEIARRYEISAKTVNQMKTALIEACINAAEHGLSPDQKIHQKFAVTDEKIVITVSNRGLRLSDRATSDQTGKPEEGRRGWGLGLIRSLMDEVRVESVDDGTRIMMTKFLT